jgi:hypothetical protein
VDSGCHIVSVIFSVQLNNNNNNNKNVSGREMFILLWDVPPFSPVNTEHKIDKSGMYVRRGKKNILVC